MTFLTNNLDWSAAQRGRVLPLPLADRSVLQADQADLAVGRLSGHHANAVRWQVWTALLVYLFLRYLAFLSDWAIASAGSSPIRAALWEKCDLLSLLRCYGTASGTFATWPGRSRPISRVCYKPMGQPSKRTLIVERRAM